MAIDRIKISSAIGLFWGWALVGAPVESLTCPASLSAHPLIVVDIENSFEAVHKAGDQLILVLERAAKQRDSQWNYGSQTAIVMHEFLVDAVMHGGKLDPLDGRRIGKLDSSKRVQVTLELSHSGYSFTIRDQGVGYNPMNVPDPTLTENLERPTGRGLALALAFSKQVEYRFDQGSVHVFHFDWDQKFDPRPFSITRIEKLKIHNLPAERRPPLQWNYRCKEPSVTAAGTGT